MASVGQDIKEGTASVVQEANFNRNPKSFIFQAQFTRMEVFVSMVSALFILRQRLFRMGTRKPKPAN